MRFAVIGGGGYAVGESRRIDKNIDVLWQGLAEGSVNSSLFFMAGANSEGMMAVDGGYADYFEPWIPEFREICESAGPLVRASIPIDDGVGIYYSHLSNHANRTDTRFSDISKTQELLVRQFDSLGVNVKFVTDRMILAGQLDAKSTPILIMGMAKAIPDKLPAALITYVKSGGVLIADVVPDLRREHLVETKPGRLLSLFGAESKDGAEQAEEKIAFQEAVIGEKRLFLTAGKCLIDKSLELTDGNAAGKAGATPILIWRKIGQGLALLLNFDLYHAVLTAELEKAETTPSGDFLLELMDIAGVEPEFQPAEGLPWETIRRFRHADATIVGLNNWRGPKDKMGFSAYKKVNIHPLREDWGDDVAGELALPGGVSDSGLIAILPEGERSIKIDMPEAAKPGDIVPVKVKVMKNGKELAGTLIRFDVLCSDVSCSQAQRSFMLTEDDGTASFTWAVELDAKGVQTLKAVELVSGTAATSKIDIK